MLHHSCSRREFVLIARSKENPFWILIRNMCPLQCRSVPCCMIQSMELIISELFWLRTWKIGLCREHFFLRKSGRFLGQLSLLLSCPRHYSFIHHTLCVCESFDICLASHGQCGHTAGVPSRARPPHSAPAIDDCNLQISTQHWTLHTGRSDISYCQ